MPTMTIENMPDDLYKQIEESAREHGRSIDNEVILCLKQALKSGRIDPEVFLARVEAREKRSPLPPLTDAILREAREGKRP